MLCLKTSFRRKKIFKILRESCLFRFCERKLKNSFFVKIMSGKKVVNISLDRNFFIAFLMLFFCVFRMTYLCSILTFNLPQFENEIRKINLNFFISNFTLSFSIYYNQIHNYLLFYTIYSTFKRPCTYRYIFLNCFIVIL